MKPIRSILVPMFAAKFLMSWIFPSALMAQAGAGKFEGTIFKDDLKTPVLNAVVKIKRTETGEEYQSKASDAKGAFSMAGIKEGWYGLGVTAAAGNFNFEYKEVFIKGGETAKLDIALKSGVLKGFFTSPIGTAMVATNPGEEALRACRSAMDACEKAYSTSANVEARLAYQRAVLTCGQAYFDVIAAYLPGEVNEKAYKANLAFLKDARLSLEKLDEELVRNAAPKMNKSMGEDKKDDSLAKKVDNAVKEVKKQIQIRLEPPPSRGPGAGAVRG